MKKNEILKIYGTDYKEMTKRLLCTAGLAGRIPGPETRIALKPNLVNPTPASFGATTHPEIISGIIEYLLENGFRNIVIAEGAWIGDRTSEAFEYCGYNALAKKYGVRLIDTQKDGHFTKSCAGEKIMLCSFLKDTDFLINVPVLKGHSQTGITCALKNLKGIIPNSEKRSFHARGLHRPIAALNALVKQDFIVIDHICGDPEIEDGGHPLVTNCIMAALDPVLTDAYVCRLLNCPRERAAYVGLAEELGVGSAGLSSLKVSVLEGEDREVIPENFRRIRFAGNITDIDSCSACYTNLCEALDRLAREGRLAGDDRLTGDNRLAGDDRLAGDYRPVFLHEKICIGQGYKGSSGHIGIGNCTSKFTHTVPGCPPGVEDIYTFLNDLYS